MESGSKNPNRPMRDFFGQSLKKNDPIVVALDHELAMGLVESDEEIMNPVYDEYRITIRYTDPETKRIFFTSSRGSRVTKLPDDIALVMKLKGTI